MKYLAFVVGAIAGLFLWECGVLISQFGETTEQRIARVVARDNPKLVPDPLIHPDINKQWVIQYNPETKKFRALWLFTHTALWFECDTREEVAQRLNERHLENVRNANSGWETVKP